MMSNTRLCIIKMHAANIQNVRQKEEKTDMWATVESYRPTLSLWGEGWWTGPEIIPPHMLDKNLRSHLLKPRTHYLDQRLVFCLL